nr:hypothetical protein [Bacilli bacterium]
MKYPRLLFAALLTFALASCGGGKENKREKETPKELEVSFLSSLKIDMNGAQGFAIKKGKSNASKKALGPKFALADGEEEEEELNFIYTTTESYSSGDVEYDGGSITKVSFTKQTEVQTDVYDANSSLIQSDTVIHQEDIPAEINKLYATSTFTYMQYIPAGADSYRDYPYYDDSGELRYTRIDVRPDTLVYDADGVSTYDRYEYYSSPLQRNFVIDNKNGYIYEIEDFGFYEII